MGPLWLTGLQLLVAPGQPAQGGEALIDPDGQLLALGPEASEQARSRGLQPQQAEGMLLAPALADPHSVVEEPCQGRAETLASLAAAAAAGGYGRLGLLPWGRPWRDRPALLQLQWGEPLQLRLWGSFTAADDPARLAAHGDQIAAGAWGLATGAAMPPLDLLERGLALAEWGDRPLLVAPRSPQLCAGGFVRESAATLRAGWPPDPAVSEVVPLELLRSLLSQRPVSQVVLMNLSTAAGVEVLRQWPAAARPQATVSWWHLLADAASLDPVEPGWRLEPSLGGPQDRQALIGALAAGLITAVAVHHLALDCEEQLLPLDQRRAGVAGHGGLVLPLLWQELVVRRGWSSAELWRVLSWAPARLLGLEPEGLVAGSRRWLLFDPHCRWTPEPGASPALAANQPWLGQPLSGRVRATGLTGADQWHL